MRNDITKQFEDRSKPLFIPFITAGDPCLDATLEIALALEKAGADILELGVPYSDPLADGPTIQRASARALKHGVSIHDCIQLVKTMRAKGLTIPVILFTYFNPVMQFGYERLFQEMDQSGIDGLLVPDLPIEESGELKTLSNQYGKPLISLVAPTSEQRIAKIADQAEGFLYCVSSLGVTGIRNDLPQGIEQFLSKVKAHAKVPVAVGFGISTPEQVTLLTPHCDGIIVGSAIIQQIEEQQAALLDPAERPKALEKIKMFVQNLKTGVR
jgi:tryptophan synthase alpha chain